MSDSKKPAAGKTGGKKRSRVSPKFKKILLVICAGIVLVCAFVCAVFFGVFRIRHVTVKGEVPYTAQEVVEAAGIPFGKNLFLTDYDSAIEKISTSLPYTSNIRITKKLPSTVLILVDTAKPVYGVMLPGGTYAITDENLKVLEIGAELTPGTMMVEGYSGSGVNALGKPLPFGNQADDESIKEALAAISSAVNESGMQGIELINISNPDGIYILYDGRIIIRLGNASDVLKKLSLAQKSIEEENKLSTSQYGELNVTAAGRASFMPRDYKDMTELVDYMARKSAQDAEQGEEEDNGESDEDTGEDGETAEEDEEYEDYDNSYSEDEE